MGYGSVETIGKEFFATLEAGNIDKLETLVTIPFAFDRKRVIYKMKELRESLLDLLKNTQKKPLHVEEITCVNAPDYLLEDDFNRDFASKNLRRGTEYVIVATFENEKVLLFARQTGFGFYKIVGFSD